MPGAQYATTPAWGDCLKEKKFKELSKFHDMKSRQEKISIFPLPVPPYPQPRLGTPCREVASELNLQK